MPIEYRFPSNTFTVDGDPTSQLMFDDNGNVFVHRVGWLDFVLLEVFVDHVRSKRAESPSNEEDPSLQA